jgi:hypothetical protein
MVAHGDEEEKEEVESIKSVVVDGTKKRKRSDFEAKQAVEAPVVEEKVEPVSKQENVKRRKPNPAV